MNVMPLRDYQQQAIDYLHARPSAALWLDMGLGKTATVLTALTSEHLPALVIAPKRVAEEVWDVERDLWRPDLTLAKAVGTASQRSIGLHSGADVTVMGRDNIKDLLIAKPARPWRTLILDESSGFKSRASVRWRTARKLIYGKGTGIRHVWQLTGTPSPNGMMDLWAQVYLLDKGQRLGTTLGEYRGRYFTPGRRLPNGIISSWDIRPGAEKKIHQLLEDLCLSMSTTGRVDLPPLTYNEVSVTLPPQAVKSYKELQQDLLTNLEIIGGVVHTAANMATLSGKLSQLTSGFLYEDAVWDKKDDGSGEYEQVNVGAVTRLHDEKTKAVVEIVDGTGSPVLVFYRFKEELKALRRAMPQAETMDAPNAIKRWNRGEIPVLLAHPLSAGHGLNLQRGGHTVVWSTLPWSLEEWEQANKRVHRSGQQFPVVIHVIMAHSPSGARTVDHLIRARLTGKANVQDALIEHLESPL